MDTTNINWTRGIMDLMIAIPKKRGSGFLRMPIGHHSSILADFIQFELGDKYSFSNSCGLDGFLNIEVGYEAAHNKELCTKIVKDISDFLKIPFEEKENDRKKFLDFIQSNLHNKKKPQ